MFQSHIIDVAGQFAGIVIIHEGKFRLAAPDPRLKPLDGSEWPSLPDVHRAVRRALDAWPQPGIS